MDMTPEQNAIANSNYQEMVDILTFANRSQSTLINYRTYAFPFMEYCFDTLGKDPSEADEADVRSYLLHIKKERDLNNRTLNLAASAVKFLFLSVLDLPWNKYKVPQIAFDEYVPFVPTKEEIQTFLASVPEPKLKAILTIMYATGLRVNEACNLRYGDVSRTNLSIHVAPSKRGRERYVELPDNCFRQILDYAHSLPSKTRAALTKDSWLFPQQRSSDKHIYNNYVHDNLSSIEQALGWPRRFVSHSFRRAFATHNYLDGNLTMEEIQDALGHKSIATTKLYVRRGVQSLMTHHANSIDGMDL